MATLPLLKMQHQRHEKSCVFKALSKPCRNTQVCSLSTEFSAPVLTYCYIAILRKLPTYWESFAKYLSQINNYLRDNHTFETWIFEVSIIDTFGQFSFDNLFCDIFLQNQQIVEFCWNSRLTHTDSLKKGHCIIKIKASCSSKFLGTRTNFVESAYRTKFHLRHHFIKTTFYETET